VQDVGDNAAIYTLSTPTCTGTFGNGACNFGAGGNTVSLNSGQTGAVTVHFTTEPTGQIVVQLHATATAPNGTVYSDDDSVRVFWVSPAVQVSPVASSQNAQTNASGSYSFDVHNTGTYGTVTYSLQVTGCTAPLTNCSAPASVTVAQSADSIVAVSFQTEGVPGTGQLSLRAYKTLVHTYESTGTGNVNVSSRISASTSFMNNDDQDVGLCAASCFAMTASRSTVPYYTLDTPRSVTLTYNGDRAFPRPFIYVDVSDSTAPTSIQSYTLEVLRNGTHLPFVNGETTLTFAGTTSPAVSYRLAGQIDMSSYNTGIDSVTVLVTAHYTNGESDIAVAKTQLMIVNSTRNSDAARVASGWTIAGVQHLRATPEGIGSPGGGYMIENGDGSAIYFAHDSAIGADFSKLQSGGAAAWTRTYPDSSKVLFDSRGRMTAAVDRLGRQTQLRYGGFDSLQVAAIIEPMRSSGSSTSAPYLSLSYDHDYNLSAITETGGAGGRTTTVTVESSGLLTRITDPDGGYDSYGYDGSGRLHTITDRRGSTTTYNYGSSWKLSSVVSPLVPIDAGGGSTVTGTLTDTLSAWQAVGVPFVATATNPAALLLPSTVAARVSDALGHTSKLFPNRWGEALKTIDALGNVTTVQYQGFLPTVVTNPDSSVDSVAYNATNGLVTSQRAAGQERVSYTYGNGNQVATVTGAGVVSVTNTLDSMGRVKKTLYGTVAGDTTTFTYDSVTKNVSSTTQPNVGRTVFAYDPRFGNMVTDTAPGNRVTASYFDAYGRDTSDVAPQHPRTSTHYDVLNRVTAAHNGLIDTDSVAISYDALLPVAVRDPSSHVDSTEYDALGRVTRHFGYASSTTPTTIRYDAASEPTSGTNRRGQRIDVTYDTLGRVLTKTADGVTDTFTYSADGLTQTASNATSVVRTVSVPKALLDTVQTTIRASGVAEHRYTVVHYHSKYSGGTDSTTISSDGAPAQLVTRRYVSDSTNGALKAIDLGSTIGAGTFTSDVAGWRVGTSWPNASRTSSFLTTGTHAYETYGSLPFYAGYRVDSAGRILRDHRPDGGSSYNNRIFGYDELGRYTGTTTVSESAYPWACGGSGSFDPNYGQVGCAIDSLPRPYVYSYDGVGNRVGTGITYNGVGDQVSTSDGFSYTYDADGNVATRSQSSTGTVWTYDWSSDNRLRSASSTLYGIPNKMVSFDYGPLGSQVVKRDSAGSATRVTRVTLYDGSSILADLDSAGNREAEYVYDEGTDRPYVMLTGSTTVTGARYYAQDDIGNVQGQFSDATHPTETVTYGDWGLPSIAGDTTNRLTWKGLSYDRDVGLTYMRARWYDPMIGRFVSEDPLGLGGGINPYVYANNDPINGFDPTGMSENEDPCAAGGGHWELDMDTGRVDCMGFVPGGGGGDGQPLWPTPVSMPGDAPAPPFDPFAGDPLWTHPDGPGPNDGGPSSANPNGGSSSGSAKSTPKWHSAKCVAAGAQLLATTASDAAFFTGIGAGARILVLASREAELGAMFARGAAQGVVHAQNAAALRGIGTATIVVTAQGQWGADGIWAALGSGASHWRNFVPGFDWWEAYKDARAACSGT
jgi:RHS repeat-associated protein